jgi:hypothetical protein
VGAIVAETTRAVREAHTWRISLEEGFLETIDEAAGLDPGQDHPGEDDVGDPPQCRLGRHMNPKTPPPLVQERPQPPLRAKYPASAPSTCGSLPRRRAETPTSPHDSSRTSCLVRSPEETPSAVPASAIGRTFLANLATN